MPRFKVYSNPQLRRPAQDAPLNILLQGMARWFKGLVALLFRDAPSPPSPSPKPKAGALFRGARLQEDVQAVARHRAA